jgi:hypothetical protein
MSFESLSPNEAASHYRTLYQSVRRQYYSFNGFDQFNLRVFKGNFLLLKNRFNRKIYGWFEENEPKILVTHYIAKDKLLGVPQSLGSILVDDLLEEKAIRSFQKELAQRLSSKNCTIVAPLNGHEFLGFSVPAPGVDPKKIAILTSSSSSGIHKFFHESRYFKKERTFFAYVNNIKSKKEAQEELNRYNQKYHKPKGFEVRRLSLLNYKRDIRIYNRIVNISFQDQYLFFPLTFEEEWELMKNAFPIIRRDYFRFLVHKGREIAFLWYLPDYNQLFTNGRDVMNFLRIRKAKSHPKRIRGVMGAVLPEYRGKRMMKQLRNEIIASVLKDNVEEIEGSYIDEENINSLSLSRSTGAQYSHEFHLYRFTNRP